LKTDERIKTGYVSQYSFSKVNNAAYHRLFSYCNVIYLVDLKVVFFFHSWTEGRPVWCCWFCSVFYRSRLLLPTWIN